MSPAIHEPPLAVAPLVPHAGAMCLLERVLRFDASGIVCATRTHRAPSNPLRSAHGLAGLHLAEYGAQAMAAHGTLLARMVPDASGKARAGMLVSIRGLTLHVGRLDELDGELLVEATRLIEDANGLVYDFRATCDEVAVGEGRVAVLFTN